MSMHCPIGRRLALQFEGEHIFLGQEDVSALFGLKS